MSENKPFVEAFDHLLGVEGGYVNDEVDRGGATRYGITEAVARNFGYKGAMNKLPLNIAMTIYREQYWDSLLLDDIAEVNYDLAYQIFDAGVNSGVSRVGKWFQRLLNVMRRANRVDPLYHQLRVDGQVGPVTIKAFSTYAETDNTDLLLALFKSLQGNHYITICESTDSQQRFLRGWTKRIL